MYTFILGQPISVKILEDGISYECIFYGDEENGRRTIEFLFEVDGIPCSVIGNEEELKSIVYVNKRRASYGGVHIDSEQLLTNLYRNKLKHVVEKLIPHTKLTFP